VVVVVVVVVVVHLQPLGLYGLLDTHTYRCPYGEGDARFHVLAKYGTAEASPEGSLANGMPKVPPRCERTPWPECRRRMHVRTRAIQAEDRLIGHMSAGHL
jgi:hypothetical protein